MISVLIMEDKEAKLQKLQALLVEECNVPASDITVARTINDGRKLLSSNYYDLLLLDLVMPAFQDSEPDMEDAPRFIDEMYNNPNLKIPNQIIGQTAHDDKFEELKQRFEDKLWYLVRYKDNDSAWKGKIKSKVFHLQRNKAQLEKSIESRNSFDYGIICALREEFNAVKDSFECEWNRLEVSEFPIPVFTTVVTTAFGHDISICATCVDAPGLVPTSILSTAMYQVFKVKGIFMTGFSAGFPHKDINYGDIIVARSVQDYASGKIVENDATGALELLREVKQMQADDTLISYASELIGSNELMAKLNLQMIKSHLLNSNEKINADLKPTVCGPFVIAAEKAMNDISSLDRKIRALDMEGFGLYSSAYKLRRSCLWIKGVADLGDKDKGDMFHDRGSYASALFLYYMIKEFM